MEEQLFDFLKNIGGAGVIGLLIWKVLAPLTTWYTSKEKAGSVGNGKAAHITEILTDMRNNDFHEVGDKLDVIIKMMQEEQYERRDMKKKMEYIYEQTLKKSNDLLLYSKPLRAIAISSKGEPH